MKLHDLDFSNRLPIDFQKTFTIPLFPRLVQKFQSTSNKFENQRKLEASLFQSKIKSTNSVSETKKPLSIENKYPQWTEICLPFSRSFPARSYHSTVLYEKRLISKL